MKIGFNNYISKFSLILFTVMILIYTFMFDFITQKT